MTGRSISVGTSIRLSAYVMCKPARQDSIYPQTAFFLSTGIAMADDNWLRSGDPDENSVVFCAVWISAFCLGPHIIYCVYQNRVATFYLRHMLHETLQFIEFPFRCL